MAPGLRPDVVRPIRLACRVGGRGAPQRVGAIAGVTVEEGMQRGVDGPSIARVMVGGRVSRGLRYEEMAAFA